MTTQADIMEVFSSPQGEGDFVGYRQVFLRLSGCPFNCPYCDTDKSAKPFFDFAGVQLPNPIDSRKFAELVLERFGDGSNFHSYSFTGGEPLMNPEFVYDCASILKKNSKAKLHLETSGLIPEAIKNADGIFDVLSVDIKTHSYKVLKNMPFLFSVLNSLEKSKWYLKLLLDDKKHDGVIEKVLENMLKYNIKKVIVQPVDSIISESTANQVFDILYANGIEARIIPQTHKVLNLR